MYRNHHNFPAWLPILSGLSLSLAIAVYCLARSYPPEIFSPFLATRNELIAFSGVFGSAPSFLYTLALGLVIGSCVASRSARFHCLAWTGLCMLLEVSQHPDLATRILPWLGEWLSASSLQLISPYWARGIYDTNDLLATLAGGLLATILIAHTRVESGNAEI